MSARESARAQFEAWLDTKEARDASANDAMMWGYGEAAFLAGHKAGYKEAIQDAWQRVSDNYVDGAMYPQFRQTSIETALQEAMDDIKKLLPK